MGICIKINFTVQGNALNDAFRKTFKLISLYGIRNKITDNDIGFLKR